VEVANFSLEGREINVASQLFTACAGRAASLWVPVSSSLQLGLASGQQPLQHKLGRSISLLS